MVDPSVSALISAALIGSTNDPNARNIRIVVVVIRISTISGTLSSRLWILSCSSAGVPPTQMVYALGRLDRAQIFDLLWRVIADLSGRSG